MLNTNDKVRKRQWALPKQAHKGHGDTANRYTRVTVTAHADMQYAQDGNTRLFDSHTHHPAPLLEMPP